MKLLDTDIARFQELYRSKLGIELDSKTAYAKLKLLTRQVQIFYRPITKHQLDAYLAKKDENEDESNQPEK